MSEKSPQQSGPTPEEVARYNHSDWLGSESFHPQHLRLMGKKWLEAAGQSVAGDQLTEVDADQLPEIPGNIILGEE